MQRGASVDETGLNRYLRHRCRSRRLCRSFSIALPPEHDSSSSSFLHHIVSINPSYRGDTIGLVSSWLLKDSGSRPSLLIEAKSQAHRWFHHPTRGHCHPSMMRQEGITAFSPSCMPIMLPLSALLALALSLITMAIMDSRISTSKCSRLRRRCLPRPETAVTRPTCTAPCQVSRARSPRVRHAGRTRFVIASDDIVLVVACSWLITT